jgi:hypothetical protein
MMVKRYSSIFHDPTWCSPLSPRVFKPEARVQAGASSARGAASVSHPAKAAIKPIPISPSENAVQVWSAYVRSVHGLAVEGLLL